MPQRNPGTSEFSSPTLNQSIRRFSLLWWIILGGFSRSFLRYKVRFNIRVVAMGVSDTQRDFSTSCVFLWVFRPYGNDKTPSALLKAELQQKSLWMCLCSQAGCPEEVGVGYRFGTPNPGSLLLSCVTELTSGIGPQKVSVSSRALQILLQTIKPNLAPVIPLNNNLWAAKFWPKQSKPPKKDLWIPSTTPLSLVTFGPLNNTGMCLNDKGAGLNEMSDFVPGELPGSG